MKELKDIKLLKVYQVNEYEYNNYLIYIFEDEENYELYLQNKNYGVLALMYGVPKEQNTLEELLNCYNLDEYIQIYQEEYED
jgi:hypothetical protein